MALLRNLNISRLINHEIVAPVQIGQHFTVKEHDDVLSTISSEINDTICRRITDVLGISTNKSIELIPDDTSEGSFFSTIPDLLQANNDSFLEKSKYVAHLLADTQGTDRRRPPGPIFFLSGTTSRDNLRFLCLVKAEFQEGLHSDVSEDASEIKLLNRIFLTPNQKFYKLLFVVQNTVNATPAAEDYNFYLFDQNMTRSSKDAAAKYFYNKFLGLKLPESPALKTKTFFKETSYFVNDQSQFSTDEKIDLHTHLYSYLTAPRRETISPATFARDYIEDENLRSSYRDYIAQYSLGATFPIDLKFITKDLKTRSFSFSSGSNLRFNSVFFNNHVEIDIDEEGGTTTFTISDSIQ
ncbi:nucleoid-associated protein [Bacteriovorax sp. Seq25_V]|uniref:nucleoid-associated protein n=1 Tax=Bacteriovorax sp. Seq25_V TaxID=1201288 RepID=UPI000389F451|nr:nucleoid-associated protein [Bacteriovorax sp. Seq25_V]EQC47637.1 nucleoid-associated protein NdpA [Bacteriovorax sp. Seq25_V]